MPEITLRYRLVSVKPIVFITIPDDQIPERLTNEDFVFNIHVNLRWKPEEESVDNTCIIAAHLKGNKQKVLTLETLNTYYIDNFKEVLKFEGKKVTAPDKLLSEIFTVSVNTARGIIIGKNQNTRLQNLFLPTFDAHKMIEEIKAQRAKEGITPFEMKSD